MTHPITQDWSSIARINNLFNSKSFIINPENVTASYVLEDEKRNWIDDDMVFL